MSGAHNAVRKVAESGATSPISTAEKCIGPKMISPAAQSMRSVVSAQIALFGCMPDRPDDDVRLIQSSRPYRANWASVSPMYQPSRTKRMRHMMGISPRLNRPPEVCDFGHAATKAHGSLASRRPDNHQSVFADHWPVRPRNATAVPPTDLPPFV